MIDTADRLALHELIGRYCDLIDSQSWDGLAAIFTPDATFDITEVGGPLMDGLAAIQHHMAEVAQHPLAHHVTNIWVDDSGDPVVLHSRFLGVRDDLRVVTGHYRDELVRTPHGWRVTARVYRAQRRPA